jgi:hypothetical protein
VNADLLIGQLRDGLVNANEVDPNAAISGSTQTVDGDSIDDERFFTTSTTEGDSPSTPAAGSTQPVVSQEDVAQALDRARSTSSPSSSGGGLFGGSLGIVLAIVGAIGAVVLASDSGGN